ncbi:MAG: indolepyruvate ferredoxin oxidoreductase family protein, partial [Alphaproteobacteria bacterium]
TLAPATLGEVTLDDRYALEEGRVFLTGTQALVRLPMMQRRRDAAAGLNTACFISGYRGSPLGGLDRELWRAKRFVEENQIHFVPGVNEDLAATAAWGSQQVGLFPGARYDGVFAMWYGKGPGVDRSGDALKHANNAGTAALGGVLALAGDDHTCKSSTLPHQSEFAFVDASIPVLNPAGVQEFLDLGLYGWALSRYSGLWVGFKTVAETVDTSASVSVDPGRVTIALPEDFAMPVGGLNIRWPDPPLDQERRLHEHKLEAARAFVRANGLDRVIIDAPRPRLGIVTAGKSFLDVRQALDDLGIDEALAAEAGLRLYKPAMTWPLEPEGIRRFADGLEEILVVEEKRALIEPQIKDLLYDLPDDRRPRVVGKHDESGAWILPSNDELTPARIARVIADRIARYHTSARIDERLAFLAAKEAALEGVGAPIERLPYFCSGCPHNTSTRVPEGSRALAGIGCHYMALWMERDTDTFTQMGAEGATWIGQAPFTATRHVFQNIGDGTYFHSGLLAIRAAVGANVNITYKILYNDAVAMTGGQPVDGPLSVPQITHELYGEGVKRIAVVADDTGKYARGTRFAAGVTLHHRDALDRVQRELRELPGVSALIYDQVCATEKRRRRKRGLIPDPAQRVAINTRVCEGCGDCGVASNCLSVVPLETEFGRKRAIDQSSCNKDFSCLKGFCPSFVTVEGGRLRKPKAADGEAALPEVPEPQLPALDEPYGILVTGVGGMGVVTVGALLGMAAHLDGKGVSVLDMIGLAQKYGAVTGHIRIAAHTDELHAARIAAGGARLVLGCDLVVAAGFDSLAKIDAGATRAIVNSHESPTGEFTRKPDLAFPGEELRRLVAEATGPGGADFIDATGLATALIGDSIATNLFLVGYAWQKGLIPLSAAAIARAVELNGVAVEANKRAFHWGRVAAHDRAFVEARAAEAAPAAADDRRLSASLDEIIERRVGELTRYHNAAYAGRYTDLVGRVRAAEAETARGLTGLTEAVARAYFKLLAYKDEYEVARLFADGAFEQQIASQFEGDYRLRFHLAPPLFARTDPDTGVPLKSAYGRWMMTAFRVLARLKFLRGTRLDPFGYTRERRSERGLIDAYEKVIDELLSGLTHDNHALAVEIAGVPEHIRGFGHVKARHIEAAKVREADLLAAFRKPGARASAAE